MSRTFSPGAWRAAREPARLGCARRTARALAAATLLVSSASPAREQLRVRADTELVNLGVVRSPTLVEVSGGLRDDAGHPVTGADVMVPLRPGAAERALPCRSGDPLRVTRDVAAVRTDALGFFCVRLPSEAAEAGTRLRYFGDRFHSPSSAEVPTETGQRNLRLEFEPAEISASLDASSLILWVTTRVVEGGGTGDPVRLVLFHRADLEHDTETEIAATDVQLGSKAKFDVETRSLGGPGIGKLVVRFAGTGQLAPATETALIARHASARLSMAAAPRPSDPTEGVELPVGVSSSTGAVGDGWVEATVAGQPVGLAPVSAGAARVVATFAVQRGKAAIVTLRYVPGGAGWTAGEPVVVEVPIRPTSGWAGTPWLVGAAAIAYFVIRSWRRPARRASTRAAPQGSTGTGRALVELVRRDDARTGWRGRVLDAHDASPIVGARVSIVVPVFDGEGVAAASNSGDDGGFVLPHVEAARRDGARLVVTAPFHATLSEPAPADGVLSISLVSRRRALLEHLVRWSSRAGRPWAHGKEPTPLELSHLAASRNQAEVAAWASAVAEAAYGPVPPDERREADIVGLEPPLPGLGDER
jgi:hypothetical protein